MSKRWPNWRRVKIHRNYTIEEAAELLGKHKNTVRSWVKLGLPVIEGVRPQLVRGIDLAEFLRTQSQCKKQRCALSEFFCLTCRHPRRPAGDMAEYMTIGPNLGNLRALCPVCGRLIHRRVNRETLRAMMAVFDISFPQGAPPLNDRTEPREICDSERTSRP